MKLYCSQNLQEELGVRFSPGPEPTDPLDSWCAALPNYSRKLVLATLPSIRFTVLLGGIQPDQLDLLDRLMAQRIRETLQSYYIPDNILDHYIPEDVPMDLCGAAPRATTPKINAVINAVKEMLWHTEDYQKIQDSINNVSFLSLRGEFYEIPAHAMQKLLQVPSPLKSAVELEVSLHLGVYQAFRTLIIPASFTFYDLHRCIQAAYAWTGSYPHGFALTSRKGRNTMYLQGDSTKAVFRKRHAKEDRDFLLDDLLQEDDIFQYVYKVGERWMLQVYVSRYIPCCPETQPVCTHCRGFAPPEETGGVSGFQDFYHIIKDPGNPEYEEMAALAGGTWPLRDTSKIITLRLRGMFPFEPAPPQPQDQP